MLGARFVTDVDRATRLTSAKKSGVEVEVRGWIACFAHCCSGMAHALCSFGTKFKNVFGPLDGVCV